MPRSSRASRRRESSRRSSPRRSTPPTRRRGSKISYLPYKPKRRTKAQIAREAGLEPLARASSAESAARARASGGRLRRRRARASRTSVAALEGARWILMETVLRGCGARRRAPAAGVGARRVAVDGRAREGNRGRQVLRLLQRQRAAEERAVAPRPRAAARAKGRHSCGSRSCCPTKKARPVRPSPSGGSPAKAGIEQKGRPADAWLAETVRWTWKVRMLAHLEIETEQRLREHGRGGSHSRVRPQPARPAAGRAGRTAHDDGARSRDCGRASRSPSSTAPARCSTRRRSIRTSRARTGTARSARWRRSARATACSSSRSATAPPHARPTRSPPI